MSIESDLSFVERRLTQLGFGSEATRTAPPAASGPFASLVAGEAERLVRRLAQGRGIDPALLVAVTSVESGFNPRAVSPAGAVGLMQLMPGTAQAVGVKNPYDPVQNVRGGAAYLGELLERFGGDLPSALAAYNAGPSVVERFGGVPPAERRYVARVLDAYRAYRTP